MSTRELLKAIERAGSTNNVKIIKELENLKISATDRMQHFDAYMDPVTHQLQQTIYLARKNAKPADNTDLYELISWTEPKAAADTRCERRSASSFPTSRCRPSIPEQTADHELAAGARCARCFAIRKYETTALFDLLPHLLNGLTLGLLFALIALGFMLIVGLMEQINLAHGSLFALGAYFAMQLMGPRPPFPADLAKAWLALPLGWRYAATLLLAPAAVGLVGIAIEFCMRRTYGKDPLYGLLLTFGAAMVIEETIRLTWGTRDYVLQVPQADQWRVPVSADLIWSTYRFYAAGIAVAIIGLVWLLIEKTRSALSSRPAPMTARSCARSASI